MAPTRTPTRIKKRGIFIFLFITAATIFIAYLGGRLLGIRSRDHEKEGNTLVPAIGKSSGSILKELLAASDFEKSVNEPVYLSSFSEAETRVEDTISKKEFGWTFVLSPQLQKTVSEKSLLQKMEITSKLLKQLANGTHAQLSKKCNYIDFVQKRSVGFKIKITDKIHTGETEVVSEDTFNGVYNYRTNTLQLPLSKITDSPNFKNTLGHELWHAYKGTLQSMGGKPHGYQSRSYPFHPFTVVERAKVSALIEEGDANVMNFKKLIEKNNAFMKQKPGALPLTAEEQDVVERGTAALADYAPFPYQNTMTTVKELRKFIQGQVKNDHARFKRIMTGKERYRTQQNGFTISWDPINVEAEIAKGTQVLHQVGYSGTPHTDKVSAFFFDTIARINVRDSAQQRGASKEVQSDRNSMVTHAVTEKDAIIMGENGVKANEYFYPGLVAYHRQKHRQCLKLYHQRATS